jgi:Flp pilus assembly pilin Flp
MLRLLFERKAGEGMVEYALVLMLVAMILISALTVLGDLLGIMFG